MTEFADFLNSGINNAGGGGSGLGFTGPNVILPPVNISQSNYDSMPPFLNTNTTPYVPPAPPYVPPPAASSSSSSSSAPINPYDRYRNIKFSNNYEIITGMSIILLLEQV
jgi:hypothetical protein